MKHAIRYKHGKRLGSAVGFMELNKSNGSGTIKLDIFRSKPDYREVIEKLYKNIMKLLSENYEVVDVSHHSKRRFSVGKAFKGLLK